MITSDFDAASTPLSSALEVSQEILKHKHGARKATRIVQLCFNPGRKMQGGPFSLVSPTLLVMHADHEDRNLSKARIESPNML